MWPAFSVHILPMKIVKNILRDAHSKQFNQAHFKYKYVKYWMGDYLLFFMHASLNLKQQQTRKVGEIESSSPGPVWEKAAYHAHAGAKVMTHFVFIKSLLGILTKIHLFISTLKFICNLEAKSIQQQKSFASKTLQNT